MILLNLLVASYFLTAIIVNENKEGSLKYLYLNSPWLTWADSHEADFDQSMI